MAANSQWAKASEVQCIVNGIRKFTNCKYDESGERIGTTNLESPVNANGLLSFEGTVGMITTEFQGEVVTDKLGTKNVYVGAKYDDFSWTDPAGQVHTGSLVIEKRGKAGTVQGAYVFNFSGFFTGAVTGQ